MCLVSEYLLQLASNSCACIIYGTLSAVALVFLHWAYLTSFSEADRHNSNHDCLAKAKGKKAIAKLHYPVLSTFLGGLLASLWL